MNRPLLRHLLLSLFLLAGHTSGLLCELAHASEAIGNANGAPGHVNDPLEHADEAPGAVDDHSGTPDVAPLHCPRCLLLAASAMPSNDVHVAPATASRFASLTENATTTPCALARQHRLARGPPGFS